jgi:hypothetical protein
MAGVRVVGSVSALARCVSGVGVVGGVVHRGGVVAVFVGVVGQFDFP